MAAIRCVVTILAMLLGAVAIDAGVQARAAPAAITFPLHSTLDEPDASVADGQCLSTPSGKYTLRAALMQANVVNVDTTILVPAGTYTLTIPPILTYGPDTGDLNLTSPASGNPTVLFVGPRPAEKGFV